jgi:hypothetical protein
MCILKYRKCILLFCFFILQNKWADLCPLWASVRKRMVLLCHWVTNMAISRDTCMLDWDSETSIALEVEINVLYINHEKQNQNISFFCVCTPYWVPQQRSSQWSLTKPPGDKVGTRGACGRLRTKTTRDLLGVRGDGARFCATPNYFIRHESGDSSSCGI